MRKDEEGSASFLLETNSILLTFAENIVFAIYSQSAKWIGSMCMLRGSCLLRESKAALHTSHSAVSTGIRAFFPALPPRTRKYTGMMPCCAQHLKLCSPLAETLMTVCISTPAHFCENALIKVPMEDFARAIKLSQKHVEKEYHTVSTTLSALKSSVRDQKHQTHILVYSAPAPPPCQSYRLLACSNFTVVFIRKYEKN
jgi:hypothetical protein